METLSSTADLADAPSKCCSKCGTVKPVSEFYKYKRSADGFQSYCKECHSGYYAKYYEDNREDYAARHAANFQMNKTSYYARKNNYRNRVRADSEKLTGEQKERVAYLYWLAQDLQAVTGEPYEVDHIKPISKGGEHHPENLQILPRDMNRKKGAKYENT